MTGFYQDAQRIFETAQAGFGNTDFALVVRDDGGLHLIMDSPVSLQGVTTYAGAGSAFHITRSGAGVRVSGASRGKNCVLESVNPAGKAMEFLRDRPLYLAATDRLLAS